jgi:hypothetical protein
MAPWGSKSLRSACQATACSTVFSSLVIQRPCRMSKPDSGCKQCITPSPWRCGRGLASTWRNAHWLHCQLLHAAAGRESSPPPQCHPRSCASCLPWQTEAAFPNPSRHPSQRMLGCLPGRLLGLSAQRKPPPSIATRRRGASSGRGSLATECEATRPAAAREPTRPAAAREPTRPAAARSVQAWPSVALWLHRHREAQGHISPPAPMAGAAARLPWPPVIAAMRPLEGAPSCAVSSMAACIRIRRHVAVTLLLKADCWQPVADSERVGTSCIIAKSAHTCGQLAQRPAPIAGQQVQGY